MAHSSKGTILFSYLCYLNDKNEERRGGNFYKSLESMSLLRDQPCTVVAIANNCSEVAEEKIRMQSGIDEMFSIKDNLWDVCAIYVAARVAKDRGHSYCCYMYDDFVVYNDRFVEDCINFMDAHEDVGCLRVPAYSVAHMEKFNSYHTPKSINPDSVRHYNTTTNEPLKWEGPYGVGTNIFFKNNWHYTSRPTLWRTDLLLSFFDGLQTCPVMQDFEKLGCIKLHESGLRTGILDGGAMHTFKESERTVTTTSRGDGLSIDVQKLEELCKRIGSSTVYVESYNPTGPANG
jgi:hypothetical protein